MIFSTACTVGSNSRKNSSGSALTGDFNANTQTAASDITSVESKSDLTLKTIIATSLLAAALLSLLLQQRKMILNLNHLIDVQNPQRTTAGVQPAAGREENKGSQEEPLQSISTEKLDELSGALSEAIREISRRDTTISNLTANVTRSNIQRNLIRLTQTLDAARLLQTRIADGKSNPTESLEFIIDDIKSALTDHGVEFTEISPGTPVADLPAGSFAAISVIDAPKDSLKGTVKEVRSLCYFINDEGKKPRYIGPAKVILYRA